MIVITLKRKVVLSYFLSTNYRTKSIVEIMLRHGNIHMKAHYVSKLRAQGLETCWNKISQNKTLTQHCSVCFVELKKNAQYNETKINLH